MSSKSQRVIGTTVEAIQKAEAALDRQFSVSFVNWLIERNGLGINGITIFPVYDERDPRKTWDSIVRHYENSWAEWVSNFEDDQDFSHLLPFAEYGTGDFYCFDYSSPTSDGEYKIVRWSHETGETEHRADSFQEFNQLALNGDYGMD